MTFFIEILNHWGEHFLNFVWPMLWQSSLLIAIIFVLDVALRRKIRAAIRYALWMMVLVKLLLPPSLALPTSLAWWLLPSPQSPAMPQKTSYVVTYGEQTAPTIPPQFQPASAPIQTRISAAAWTLAASGAVSAGLLSWLLIRWLQINQKVRRAKTSENLISILDEARRLAHLRPGIRLKLTHDSMSPAVCGLFRPVILLPRTLVERLSAGQLRAVLMHEALHLRRGDVWVNCAQALLQIFYWWHPLLWLANARIRRLREEAVDDAVMLALRDDAEIYAPTLLEVAKLAFNRPLASLGLVGILESRSALRQRIERLVNFRAPRKAGLTLVSILGILAFTAIALPMGKAPEKTNEPMASASDLTNAASSSDINTNAVTGILILSDTNFQAAIHALKQRPQVEYAPVVGQGISASTNAVEEKMEASLLVQDGKLLYEMGKFDDAEAKLKAAIALNPDNQAAKYYLDLVEQSRRAPKSEGPRLIYPSGDDSQNNFDASSAKVMTFLISPPINENDLRKLLQDAGVKIPPTVLIYDNNGVLFVRGSGKQLALVEQEVMKLNGFSPKLGVRLAAPNPLVTNDVIHTSPGREMIFRKLNSLHLESVSWHDGRPLSEVIRYLAEQSKLRDPDKKGINFIFNPNVAASTAATNAAPETVDATAINVKLMLNNASLHDVLDAVVLVADRPIKYSVEDYAVVISPVPQPPMLEERVFKVDPRIFAAHLRSILDLQTSNVPEMAKSLFSKLGVDLTAPGRSVAYNDLGLLFVKATASELDTVERIIQALNQVSPQIHYKARFIEVPKDGFVMPITLSNKVAGQMTGILSDPEFRTVLQALEHQKGVETLAEPECVTTSGRQTQMRATETVNVTNNFVSLGNSSDSTDAVQQVNKIEIGPVVDVVPYVLSDGYTIYLKVMASVSEILRYGNTTTVKPVIGSRQADAMVNLWDDQTLVLVLKNQKSSLADAEKTESNVEDKDVILFLTATIVDPAGNRVHSADELRQLQEKTKSYSPPQPKIPTPSP